MPRPIFRAAPVRVRVPATSANLGPGFDALGLALGLFDEVVFAVADSGLSVDVAGEGADTVRRDGRHLVVKAAQATFKRLGGAPPGLAIVCANRIPHSRGLGSSAAAICAGVLGARALTVSGMDDDAVLQLAADLEGHPDNVAACLLGGLSVAWRDGSRWAAAGLPVHPDVQAVAFVPGGVKQSTSKARALLPPTVSHADAARTAGRSALLPAALGGQFGLLAPATEDWLHQPYRLPAQPRADDLVRRLRAAGIAAVLSGSGPTVLALVTDAAAAAAAAALAGRGFTAHVVDIDRAGASVAPLASAPRPATDDPFGLPAGDLLPG